MDIIYIYILENEAAKDAEVQAIFSFYTCIDTAMLGVLTLRFAHGAPPTPTSYPSPVGGHCRQAGFIKPLSAEQRRRVSCVHCKHTRGGAVLRTMRIPVSAPVSRLFSRARV